jgi:lysophospholipase L1-like esterase
MFRAQTLLLAVLLAPGVLASLHAADKYRNRDVKREDIEWTDVWMPDMNRHDLPRVLLIGDSITRAYYKGVEENLRGKAYCARIATSKAVGDPALIAELHAFLPEAKFDVIHFNIGMHGWSYSEEEYRKHLPDLLKEIRKDAPGARLIWASTTLVRKDSSPGPTNARIRARNTLAQTYFAHKQISIDDLSTLMAAHQDLHSDDVHFNSQGAALQAKQVAFEIEKLLPR